MANNALSVNRYTNMEFPDYEFVEFPKWVTPPDGKPVIVQNAEEEATIMGGDAVFDEAAAREALIAEATEKAVKFDKRWSSERIRAAIAEQAPKT